MCEIFEKKIEVNILLIKILKKILIIIQKIEVFGYKYKDIKVDLKSDIERLLRGDDQFELRLGNGNRNYIGR